MAFDWFFVVEVFPEARNFVRKLILTSFYSIANRVDIKKRLRYYCFRLKGRIDEQF